MVEGHLSSTCPSGLAVRSCCPSFFFLMWQSYLHDGDGEKISWGCTNAICDAPTNELIRPVVDKRTYHILYCHNDGNNNNNHINALQWGILIYAPMKPMGFAAVYCSLVRKILCGVTTVEASCNITFHWTRTFTHGPWHFFLTLQQLGRWILKPHKRFAHGRWDWWLRVRVRVGLSK
jgi:hypothetical protein